MVKLKKKKKNKKNYNNNCPAGFDESKRFFFGFQFKISGKENFLASNEKTLLIVCWDYNLQLNNHPYEIRMILLKY